MWRTSREPNDWSSLRIKVQLINTEGFLHACDSNIPTLWQEVVGKFSALNCTCCTDTRSKLLSASTPRQRRGQNNVTPHSLHTGVTFCPLPLTAREGIQESRRDAILAIHILNSNRHSVCRLPRIPEKLDGINRHCRQILFVGRSYNLKLNVNVILES